MNLIFQNKSLLLEETSAGFILPETKNVTNLNYTPCELKPDGVNILGTLASTNDISLDSKLKLVPLRQVFTLFADELVSQIIYAEQLINYLASQAFCNKCGSATYLAPNAKWLVCQECHREIYPQITPAMIVRVTQGNRILLAQANNFAPTQWSLLAGFCEIGETLEQTVAREVFEEVGIQIKNIRYWGSQYWPFPNTMMIGFTAEYDSGEIVLDTKEMRAAGFYTKDEIPGRPSTSYAIASQMINEFIASNGT